MGSLSSEAREKFFEILKSNQIHDEVSKVTMSKPDLKGEHMASVIEKAHFEFTSGRERLTLFVKKPLPNMPPEMAEGMGQVMVSEGTVLTEFVQEMKDLREKRNGGPDLSDLFPRVYYKDKDMVVMEDLTQRGFSTLPKKPKRNFEEAKTVFEHLARFHAVSHVLIDIGGGPEKFEESHPYLQEMFRKPGVPEMMSQAFDPTIQLCVSVMEKSSNKECQEKAEIMKNYSGKVLKAFMETIDAETRFFAVCHGDCWSNNLMFDVETHKKVILVDLQCPRINSPTMDLIRFLFFSCAPDVRKRWKELLQIYYDTLKEYVLGLEHPFPFKFEDFLADWSRKGKMDFLFSFMVIIGMDAIANHDTEDSSADFAGNFHALVTKWCDENPDKMEKVAFEMVDLINDFLVFGEL